MDQEKARRHNPPPCYHEYTARDAIIYALGVGATTKDDLRYLYEGHEDFAPYPTFIVVPGFNASGLMDWPGVDFNLQGILHGEHYIEMYNPLPTDGRIRTERKVTDILDKGKGALIISELTSYDEATGKCIGMQQFSTFQKGSGNYGGPRSSPNERPVPPVPKRPADKIVGSKTSVDQATLYRMSGDLNPLHIDSDFAAVSGFKQPILHGLCSLGYTIRHVIRAYADNDGTKVKKIKVRFTAPVIPGQTLDTHMWNEGGKVIFATKVKETGVDVAIGYVELEGLSGGAKRDVGGKMDKQELLSDALFETIKLELPNNQAELKKINGIVLYEFLKDGKLAGKWTLDLKTPPGDAYPGEPKDGKPTVTVTVEDDVFVQIAAGELEPVKAFMAGKIKAKGNILLLQKLSSILKGVNAKAKL